MMSTLRLLQPYHVTRSSLVAYSRRSSRCRTMRKQIVHFSNERETGGFKFPKVTEDNPFDILGIPKSSSYQNVKQKFVELALKYHPDVSENRDDDKDVEEFIRLREAFEAIQENSDGSARLTKDGDLSMSDEEFHAWFYEETGHHDVMFKMDLRTRKEVIEAATEQSQGGLDRGGMWEMARNMAQQQESLKNKKKRFKTTVGIEEPNSTSTNTRRRRRR